MIDCLLILLFDLDYLFVCFFDWDVVGIGKGLCCLLVGFVVIFFVICYQGVGCIYCCVVECFGVVVGGVDLGFDFV